MPCWDRSPSPWRRNDWASVLFTDESIFNLRRSDCGARVYRRRGECYRDAYVVENHHLRGGSVMVWCGISPQNKKEVQVIDENLNVQRCLDEILAPVVTPLHPHLILMQDNATSHSTRTS